jgi:putative ATPase
LAARLRPTDFAEFVGQAHIVGTDSALRSAIDRGALGSVILWGPAGSGKTTLAHLSAERGDFRLEARSAVTCGVAEIRKIGQAARASSRRTLLFLDEIHHFSRSQQDSLLGYVEDGTLTLVGATTENPAFSLATPLLSRCRVLVLKPLSDSDVEAIVRKGLEFLQTDADSEAVAQTVRWANGDARTALNGIELASQLALPERIVGPEHVSTAMNMPLTRYDQKGDQHYDVISAFIKSVRGSDPDAALHYLARMIKSGEDPRFIARRLVILASEDIGNAAPMGLLIAMAAFHAVERIGMPEARITLAQAAIFLAASPKSNSAYLAIEKALADLADGPAPPVPDYLRDKNTKLFEETEGEYKYPHDFGGRVAQEYLAPNSGLNLPYYLPIPNGYEEKLKSFLEE